MEKPEDIDYLASPAWWGSDRLYEALRPAETPPLVSCPLCGEIVWAMPDGELLDNLAYNIAHRCRAHERVPLYSNPLLTETESRPTGGTHLSELEHIIGEPTNGGQET